MAAGPLMLDLEGPSLSTDEEALLGHPMVGGVIFFARNFVSRQQMTDLAGQIRALRPELLLAVDQEGGRVQRFREGYTRLPAMARLGAGLDRGGDAARRLLVDTGWLMAVELLASGMDFSFAPVLDVDRDHCQVIADRAFGDDPDLVEEAAGLFISGMHKAGMAATGKHFPGHGGVTGDSHAMTPMDNRGLAALEERDLRPFRALAPALGGIMPAHIVFPEVDNHCVGFSRRWLGDILRRLLGFEGVIFSDDLSMKGAEVAGGYADRARVALEAGCDMVLVCNARDGALAVLDYLEQAKPQPSPRLAGMKARRQWHWCELEQSNHRQDVIERLAAIDRG